MSDRDPRYLQGIEHFNRHEFFEAHDIWEELWRELRGDPDRDFYQGLIQAAVALHHYRNENLYGAAKMWGYARDRLMRFRPHHEGLDVGAFISGMQRALATVRRDEAEPFDPGKVPVLRLEDA